MKEGEGLAVRRAHLADTPAMLEITQNVWEGHDYVPRVWQSWISDHSGILLVAEEKGLVVGFQHAELMPDNTGWLEGIRVREDVQGSGVGSALLAAGIEWSRFSSLSAVRLSTSSDNPASNRMAERAGFNQVAHMASVKLRAGTDAASGIARVARPDELGAVVQALDVFPGAPYYTEGWTAYGLTEARVRLLLGAGQVLVCGQPEIEAVAIAVSTPERSEPRIGLLRGSCEGMIGVLNTLGSALLRLGVKSARSQLQISGDMLARLGAHGLERAWEHDLVLWELPLAQSSD
jgi:N-acetylglutamate synthase-like GNAT family acetyltransferase